MLLVHDFKHKNEVQNLSKCINNSGSRRLFVNSDKKKITLHEPHPGNKVKKPYKKEVIKTLIERGELEK